MQSISTKIKRSVGILSKLRYYVNLDIFVNLYYSLIYPFLIYGLVVWGSTYHTNIDPRLILQKRALRITTFSKFDDILVHYLNKQTYLSSLTLLNFKEVYLWTNSIIINYLIFFQVKKCTTIIQGSLGIHVRLTMAFST